MKPSEAIANIEYARKWLGSESDFSDEALDVAISALEKQEKDRWIPVTERLPEEDGDYLVTCDVCEDKYVEMSLFITCDDGDVFWTAQNVIAWKDRPEPYQEGNNETE